MAGRRIDECRFSVVDVETTGIDANSCRIIEVAVLTCDWTGAVLDSFETLVRPEDVELSPTRAEMLVDAPTFAGVAAGIVEHLSGGVVAGHNVSFDLRFLNASLARLGERLPAQPYVCTRELATLLGCDVANRTLASLCVHFGVPFERWHTAADDAGATSLVLGCLLNRAVGYGRVQLSSIESWWPGPGTEWPTLTAGTAEQVLVRDPARWPPIGDQPGSRRATDPSFRRLGEGPASPSGAAVITSPAEESSLSASELWWQGDFRGLEGLAALLTVILPDFRRNDDPELVKALMALADLLRRHGGRDAEVRATFEEARTVAVRRSDVQALNDLTDQLWSYLGELRDTDAQVQLLLRSLRDGVGDPMARLHAQLLTSRKAEPIVARRLARGAMSALLRHGYSPESWDVLVALAEILIAADQEHEAESLLEDAWTRGCDSPAVLDVLSRHLEQSGDYARAIEVCARALVSPALVGSGVADRLRRRHRRCQERLAQAATLFG